MNVSECTIGALFDLSHTLAEGYLAQFCYPWEAVGGIGQFLRALICRLRGDKNFCERSPGVLIHRSAHIALSAELRAPCIVCADAEVRHGALLRGQVLVGRGCVVGNSVELKNSILFDGVHVPHFNYIGDSLLGYRSHFGAGAVTSNVKSDRSEVCVRVGERAFATGGYKCGDRLQRRALSRHGHREEHDGISPRPRPRRLPRKPHHQGLRNLPQTVAFWGNFAQDPPVFR